MLTWKQANVKVGDEFNWYFTRTSHGTYTIRNQNWKEYLYIATESYNGTMDRYVFTSPEKVSDIQTYWTIEATPNGVKLRVPGEQRYLAGGSKHGWNKDRDYAYGSERPDDWVIKEC